MLKIDKYLYVAILEGIQESNPDSDPECRFVNRVGSGLI